MGGRIPSRLDRVFGLWVARYVSSYVPRGFRYNRGRPEEPSPVDYSAMPSRKLSQFTSNLEMRLLGVNSFEGFTFSSPE